MRRAEDSNMETSRRDDFGNYIIEPTTTSDAPVDFDAPEPEPMKVDVPDVDEARRVTPKEPTDDKSEQPEKDKAATEPEPEPEPKPKEEPGSEPDKKDDEDQDDSSDDPKGYTKRINKLVYQRREAERNAAAEKKRLEDRIAELEAKATSGAAILPDAQQGTPAPEPKEDDFEDYSAYTKALIKWETSQQKKPEPVDIDAKIEAAVEARLAAKQTEESVRTFIENGIKKYPDFEDVALSKDVPYSPEMIEVMRESESFADLAYYFGQNHDEADRISRMTPIAAAREIGRLEVRIESTATREGAQNEDDTETGETTKSSPPKKPSKASPPITPLAGSDHVTPNLATSGTATFREVRMRQMKEDGLI